MISDFYLSPSPLSVKFQLLLFIIYMILITLTIKVSKKLYNSKINQILHVTSIVTSISIIHIATPRLLFGAGEITISIYNSTLQLVMWWLPIIILLISTSILPLISYLALQKFMLHQALDTQVNEE